VIPRVNYHHYHALATLFISSLNLLVYEKAHNIAEDDVLTKAESSDPTN
jgi:hypothetical protein